MKGIVCPRCNSEMLFDDAYYEFRGKGTEYFVCSNEKCDCNMSQDIRFNKVWTREWYWSGDVQKFEKFDINTLDGGEFQ